MKLTLVKKIDEARGTKSFFFDIVNDFSPDETITWLPGQYIYITLSKLNYPDERGSTRHFTISASPTEGKQVRVTMRMRQTSGYKKSLDELPIGSIVEGKGPQGTFTFSEETKNNVFLAGGIGITPFRSMIKYNIDKKLNIPMYLIHSNSDSEFVFKNEFDNWTTNNQFVKVQYVNTSELGHLGSDMIEKYLDDWNLKLSECTFWAVGPNVFVDAMEDALQKLKVAEDNIRTEKFTGY